MSLYGTMYIRSPIPGSANVIVRAKFFYKSDIKKRENHPFPNDSD
jgi:hypothetical protein